MVFILAVTVWIYVRHHRTPLEIISPAIDRLLINYAVLPWKNRCPVCGRHAHFRCDHCGRSFCAMHGKVNRRLEVSCVTCSSQETSSGAPG